MTSSNTYAKNARYELKNNDIINIRDRIQNNHLVLWSYLDRIRNIKYAYSLVPDANNKTLVLGTSEILKKYGFYVLWMYCVL